jgi:hypothetical protein
VTTRFAPHAGGLASLNHNFSISETGIFLRGALDSSGKTGGGFLDMATRMRNVRSWAKQPV